MKNASKTSNNIALVLIVSILINVGFGIILALYALTPYLDWVTLKKSGPSFCNHVNIESEELAQFCELMKKIE